MPAEETLMIPRFPLTETVGMRVAAAGPGVNTQELDVPSWLLDGDGRVPPGVLALLADATLGYAASAAKPPEESMVTTHLALELLGRLPLGLSMLRCSGVQRWTDGRTALARGQLTDQDGRVLAYATLRSLFVAPSQRTFDIPPVTPLVAATLDDALGTRVLQVAARVARTVIDASPCFANSGGGLHGGWGALAGERALDLALRSALPSDNPMCLVELHVAYLRPVPAAGEQIECRAEAIHVGRRLAATRGEVLTPDGRVALLVDGIHALVEAA